MTDLTKRGIIIKDVVEVIEPPIERGIVTRIEERHGFRRISVKWFKPDLGISVVFNGECRLIGVVNNNEITPLVAVNTPDERQSHLIKFEMDGDIIRVNESYLEQALEILFDVKDSNVLPPRL